MKSLRTSELHLAVPRGPECLSLLRVHFLFSNQLPPLRGKQAARCTQASDLLVSAGRSCPTSLTSCLKTAFGLAPLRSHATPASPLLAVAVRAKLCYSTRWEPGRTEGYFRVRSTSPEEGKVRLSSTRAGHSPRSLVCLSSMGPVLSQLSMLSFSVISGLFDRMAYRWGRGLLSEVDLGCNLHSFIYPGSI